MSEKKLTPTNADGVVIQPCILKPRAARTTYTPCGDQFIIQQEYYFDDKGNKKCKPGKKFDLDAFIQSSLPSCDITAILAKVKLGDESVLHVHENGFVGDTTTLPKDLYDVKRMNDLYDNVTGAFNKLPADIQALFKNDSAEFLNSILNNKAESLIKDYKLQQEKTKESEVKENA